MCVNRLLLPLVQANYDPYLTFGQEQFFFWVTVCLSDFTSKRQQLFHLVLSLLPVSHVLKGLCVCAPLWRWCGEQPNGPGIQVGSELNGWMNELICNTSSSSVTHFYLSFIWHFIFYLNHVVQSRTASQSPWDTGICESPFIPVKDGHPPS